MYTTLKLLYENFTIYDGFSKDHQLFGNEKTHMSQCSPCPTVPRFTLLIFIIIMYFHTNCTQIKVQEKNWNQSKSSVIMLHKHNMRHVCALFFLTGISSMVCEHLCHSEYYSEVCNGFWYNRTSSECVISTVLMKNGVSAVDGPCEKDSIEYYEKQVILGKLSKCKSLYLPMIGFSAKTYT